MSEQEVGRVVAVLQEAYHESQRKATTANIIGQEARIQLLAQRFEKGVNLWSGNPLTKWESRAWILAIMEENGLAGSKPEEKKQISPPAKTLVRQGILPSHKKGLDYGGAHGCDAEYLQLDLYDPRQGMLPPDGKYEVITCLYVLDGMSGAEQREAIEEMEWLLDEGGVVYIAGKTRLRIPPLIPGKKFQVYEVKREELRSCLR